MRHRPPASHPFSPSAEPDIGSSGAGDEANVSRDCETIHAALEERNLLPLYLRELHGNEDGMVIPDPVQSLDALHARIRDTERQFRQPNRDSAVRFGRTSYSKLSWNWMAGAMVVVLGVAGVLMFNHSTKPIERQIVAGPGKVLTTTLEDGSHITLAPGSRVVYKWGSGDGERLVTLDGQALFDVTQNPRKPFVVRAGDVTTTVLGTRFHVRKYTEDTLVRVSVVTGKVSTADIVLTQGDIAIVPPSGRPIVQRDQDLRSLEAWTTGVLSFDHAPLSEFLPVLSRWYGVQFVVSRPDLMQRRLSATVRASGELSSSMLEYLTAPVAIKFVRVGNTITLYPAE